MADQNQNKGQQQPSRQQEAVLPDSPYYTKDNAPDGIEPMARWLFGKGWKCLGHPNWESAVWYQPGLPDTEKAVLEPKKGYIWRPTGKFDSSGKQIHERRLEVLKQQDGQSMTGQPTVDVVQLTVTFPAQPVNFRTAVEIQLAKEERAKRDAEAAKREAERAKKEVAVA